MAFRNTWRVGDYLMHDDESGLVHYKSEMLKIWDGTWRHHTNFETRQPQEFVRARNDPKALRHIRPEPDVAKACSVRPILVGGTSFAAPQGPASHLFDPGIGDMEVGCTFIVRPDTEATS